MPPNTEYQVTTPTRFGRLSTLTDGQSVSPAYAFSSESSLGFYRSAASVIATSYGTFAPSGLSVVGASVYGDVTVGGLTVQASGQTGTEMQSASATSFLGVAMVVQGSASSFSLFVWPAARRGDFLMVVPEGAGVSSLSSGLVLHSHCTQNGQVEVRWSNVSTLVQNQSAVSYRIARFAFF